MEEVRLSAKPIQAFRLAGKLVLACHVAETDPIRFLGKEFLFFSDGRPRGRIKIEGISTASQREKGIYDFSYSGDEIRPEQIGGNSLIRTEKEDQEGLPCAKLEAAEKSLVAQDH